MKFFVSARMLMPFIIGSVLMPLTACTSLMAGLTDDLKQDESSMSKEAIEKKKDPTAYYTKNAKSAEDQGDYIAAAAFWGSLQEEHPDNVDYATGYIRNARKAGLLEKALEVTEALEKKHPNDAKVKQEAGYTYLAMGKVNEALTAFGIASNAEPQNIKLLSVQGVASDRLGQYTQAQSFYEKALAIEPKNTTVLNNYALSCMMSGNKNKAQQLASKALEQPDLTPNMRQGLVRLLSTNQVSQTPSATQTGMTTSSRTPLTKSAQKIEQKTQSEDGTVHVEAMPTAEEGVNNVGVLSQPRRWGG